MSENILIAITKLFALVARIDGLSISERDKLIELLDLLLGENEEKRRLIEIFDLYSGHIPSSEEEYQFQSKEEIFERIAAICHQIKKESFRQQRIRLLSELLHLIVVDEKLTEVEQNSIRLIGEELNIEKETVSRLEKFVLAKELKEFDDPEILVVKSDKEGLGDKTGFYKVKNLNGFLAFLHLPHLKIFFFRYLGDQHLLMNKAPVINYRIDAFFPGGNISSDTFDPIYYSEITSHFKSVDPDLMFSLVGKDITLKFKAGNFGLRNVDIADKEGQLIGIMGASGSGKSTLVNVLNGNERPTCGSVTINGIDIHDNPEQIEGIMGYVPQDDLLIEDLTVFQNLFYSAKLCFKNKNDEEITEIVNKILYDLGIYETRNLKVGNVLNKTISGGQRKRLNIGLELLREPMIMFVDEPTSGLSSRDSENIMDLLKELTFEGKLIYTVIHQPSSEIFKLFDKLLILDVGGYPIYYGNPVEAIYHFRNALKIIDKTNAVCLDCGNVNTEQIFNLIELKVVDEHGYPTKKRRYSPEYWNKVYQETIKVDEPKKISNKPRTRLDIPSKLKQAKIFVERDFLSKISNRQYVVINLLEAPFLAFILAMFIRFYPGDGFTPSAYTFFDNVNIPVYIFMAIIVGLFIGLTVSAEEIIRDRKIQKRENFLHLSKSSYIISKLVILFGLSAIQSLLFVLVGNFVMEIKGMLLPYWAVVFSIACFANALGLNISSAFDSVVTIYILIPILLIPQMLLSGVMVKYDELNPSFTKKTRVPLIGELMAAKWGYEALTVTQFKDNEFEQLFYDEDKLIANADFKNVYYIPKLLGKLDYAFVNLDSDQPETSEQIDRDLAIVRHEFLEELSYVGADKFSHLDKLNRNEFDSLVYNEAKMFLNTLKNLYLNQHKKATAKKEQIINDLTSSPEKREEFEKLKKDYTNEQIKSIALNNKVTHRIIEADNELIQKIYPIYMDPDPHHPFDFTSQMYQPNKHFLGYSIDTLLFNLGIIWIMTTALILALYLELLRRIVNREEYKGVAKK